MQLLPVDCGIDSLGTAQSVLALFGLFRRARVARWLARSGWEIRELRSWTGWVSELSLGRVVNSMHCRYKLSVGFGIVFRIKGMGQAEFQD